MQIEGTPNERALLVTFAYIAGFTSAFIAFGAAVGTGTISPSSVVVSPTSQEASVQRTTQSEQPTDFSAEIVNTSAVDVVTYINNGLYVETDAEFPTLLSKQADVAGVTYSTDDPLTTKQGFHTSIPHYEYIAALEHVFYCEQYDTTGFCTPYLYDIAEQVLHVFTVDEEPLTIDNRQAQQVTVTNAGTYVLGGYRSASAGMPWEMVAQ